MPPAQRQPDQPADRAGRDRNRIEQACDQDDGRTGRQVGVIGHQQPGIPDSAAQATATPIMPLMRAPRSAR